MAAHPAGFIERAEAFGPGGTYGKWLRRLPSVVKVGDTLFVHGGISPDLASWPIDRLNDAVAGEIRSFDAARRFMIAERIALPFDALLDLVHAAGTPAARQSQDVLRFHGYDHWISIDDNGPLWFREYARWSDGEGALRLPPILEAFGVARVVVGHSSQRGIAMPRFDGRVYLADSGMLGSYFPDGRGSALVIEHGVVRIVYDGGSSTPR